MPDDPAEIDENELVKEVYAHFGLAAYQAQCVEMSLNNFFLINKRVSDATLTVQELDSMEAARQKQTMGKLIKDFRTYVDLSTDCEELLNRALEKRNFLMHHFFRERAVQFMANGGRWQMIDELTEITNDLKFADTVIIAVYDNLRRVLGVTDEILDREYAKLMAEAKLL